MTVPNNIEVGQDKVHEPCYGVTVRLTIMVYEIVEGVRTSHRYSRWVQSSAAVPRIGDIVRLFPHELVPHGESAGVVEMAWDADLKKAYVHLGTVLAASLPANWNVLMFRNGWESREVHHTILTPEV